MSKTLEWPRSSPDSSISDPVRKFLDKYISSPEEVEILLLLHSKPEKDWDAVDVADALGMEPFLASRHLMSLHEKGLARHLEEKGPLYHFRYLRPPDANKEGLSEFELASAVEPTRRNLIDYINFRNRRR